jgi:hypothetical protein
MDYGRVSLRTEFSYPFLSTLYMIFPPNHLYDKHCLSIVPHVGYEISISSSFTPIRSKEQGVWGKMCYYNSILAACARGMVDFFLFHSWMRAIDVSFLTEIQQSYIHTVTRPVRPVRIHRD